MASDPNEYHLVAFDAGGCIGWAHFIVDCHAFSRPEQRVMRWVKSWQCGEFEGLEYEQEQQAVQLIWRARFGDMPYNSMADVVAGGLSRADILAEDFELAQLIGGKNLLSPVRINAVLDWQCQQWGMGLILQKRSLRLQVTNDFLYTAGLASPFRRNGQWRTTGKGKDAFAAMQHAVTRLRHVKQESKRRPWKLSDKQTHNAYWDCACEERNGNRTTRGNRRACDITHPR